LSPSRKKPIHSKASARYIEFLRQTVKIKQGQSINHHDVISEKGAPARYSSGFDDSDKSASCTQQIGEKNET